MPTNEERAECAQHAVEQYGIVKEGKPDYDEMLAMAGDLLADMFHLFDTLGENIDDAIERARGNYEAEK